MSRSRYIIQIDDRKGEIGTLYMRRIFKTYMSGTLKEASRMTEQTANAWRDTMLRNPRIKERCAITVRQITAAEIAQCDESYWDKHRRSTAA